MAEDSLTSIETVASLLNVVCVWIVIHIVCNLVDARQRMKNLHVGLGELEHITVKDIYVLHALIFHKVRETLLLYARHIYNVSVGNNLLVELCMLHILDAVLVAIHLILLWHCEFIRGYEMECRVEMTHSRDERMNCTSILQVAHEVYVQIVESALSLVDRIQVEQTL